MTEPFVSYAQNGEDVVLWRALRHVENGRYVDVGANDPVDESVTMAFYERGWRGVHVEPVPYFADRLRQQRPDETVIEAVVTRTAGELVVLHEVGDSGLSTVVDDISARHAEQGWAVRDITVPSTTLAAVVEQHGLADRDVHFLKVDVEGAEALVLASVDLRQWRPWVVVVESTAPNSTEPTHDEWEPELLESGYQLCLFDGLSRFYVAEEHAELAAALAYGACILDGYRPAWAHRALIERDNARSQAERAQRDADAVRGDLLTWRAAALDRWSDALAGHDRASGQDGRQVEDLRRELNALHQTVSWRVTAPLRRVRSRTKGRGRA